MKILILRFSSYGDVLQSLIVLNPLKKTFPKAKIHWVTRLDMKELIESNPFVEKVWSIEREKGFKALVHLTSELGKENYTHIYDAHNNLRSKFICFFLLGFLRWKVLFKRIYFIRRSSRRIQRFFLFDLKWNIFKKPTVGRKTFLRPLKAWIKEDKDLTSPLVASQKPLLPPLWIKEDTLKKTKALLSKNKITHFIAFSPSASYPLKRWPFHYWQELIHQLPKTPILILGGGKNDLFLKTLKRENKNHQTTAPLLNLVNHLSFTESLSVLKFSKLLVTNDTGLLHGAEYFNIPCIALIGPSAFGYPSEKSTKVLHLHLKCSPCSAFGQRPCKNPIFQQCLRDIRPQQVLKEIQKKVSLS